MPHITSTQVERALEQIAPHHPLLIFTVPAMCKAGVMPVATQKGADEAAADSSAAHYDGRDETQFLKDYTEVAGGPAGKPFYSPSGGTRGAWVRSTYASSSLQAQRKEHLGRMFLQSGVSFYPFGSNWSEFATHVRAPASKVMKVADNKIQLVPLFALASWFFRDRDIPSTQSLLELAKSELKIPDELIGTVYDDSIPADADAIALGVEQISQEDLAAIIEAVPPPPTLTGGFSDLIRMLEKALEKRLVLGGDIVGQIVRAWAARDIVILVGAGGTGKTTLAKGIVKALEDKDILPLESSVEVTVNEDFGVSDLLGYENIASEYVDRPLTARILRSKAPLHPHVLLIEELNLTAVESYLQPILHAIESGSRISLTGKEMVELPQDTLVLATCNSPRDEPETRVSMSGPTKRRATAIQMPNLLYEKWAESKLEGLREVITLMLSNEREEIEEPPEISTTPSGSLLACRILPKNGQQLVLLRVGRLQPAYAVVMAAPLGRQQTARSEQNSQPISSPVSISARRHLRGTPRRLRTDRRKLAKDRRIEPKISATPTTVATPTQEVASWLGCTLAASLRRSSRDAANSPRSYSASTDGGW